MISRMDPVNIILDEGDVLDYDEEIQYALAIIKHMVVIKEEDEPILEESVADKVFLLCLIY